MNIAQETEVVSYKALDSFCRKVVRKTMGKQGYSLNVAALRKVAECYVVKAPADKDVVEIRLCWRNGVILQAKR